MGATGAPADGRAELYRHLTGHFRRGAVAVLSSAATVITGLGGEPLARALTPPVQVWRANLPRQPRGLSLADRNKILAVPYIVDGGWSYREFTCLDRLWTRESSWNHRARNPSSGAYGIPQALPAAKMASAGPDWRTSAVTQIRWGLSYIRGRYGSPCAAWGHTVATGWY